MSLSFEPISICDGLQPIKQLEHVIIKFWELFRWDISHWACVQGHDREQHFCFLLGFALIDRERRPTLHTPLWPTWIFQFPYHKLSAPDEQYPIFARVWSFYLTIDMISQGLILFWMFFFSEGDATFQWASRARTFEIVSYGNLWSIRAFDKKKYKALSPYVAWHSGSLPYAIISAIDKTLHLVYLVTLLLTLTFLPCLNFLLNSERLISIEHLHRFGMPKFETCTCSNVKNSFFPKTCHAPNIKFIKFLCTSILSWN